MVGQKFWPTILGLNMACISRTNVLLSGFSDVDFHHEFVDIYNEETTQSWAQGVPPALSSAGLANQNIPAIIEKYKLTDTKKTYVHSVCKYCGMIVGKK